MHILTLRGPQSQGTIGKLSSFFLSGNHNPCCPQKVETQFCKLASRCQILHRLGLSATRARVLLIFFLFATTWFCIFTASKKTFTFFAKRMTSRPRSKPDLLCYLLSMALELEPNVILFLISQTDNKAKQRKHNKEVIFSGNSPNMWTFQLPLQQSENYQSIFFLSYWLATGQNQICSNNIFKPLSNFH